MRIGSKFSSIILATYAFSGTLRAESFDLSSLTKETNFKTSENYAELGTTIDDHYCIDGDEESMVLYSQGPDMTIPRIRFEKDDIIVTFETRSNFHKVEYRTNPTLYYPEHVDQWNRLCADQSYVAARSIGERFIISWSKEVENIDVTSLVAESLSQLFKENGITLKSFMLTEGRERIFELLDEAAELHGTSFNSNASVSYDGPVSDVAWDFPVFFNSSSEEERLEHYETLMSLIDQMDETYTEDYVSKMVTSAGFGEKDIVWGSVVEVYTAKVPVVEKN